MKLILFTHSYPFGQQEPWISKELDFLSGNFDSIEVVSCVSSPGERPHKCGVTYHGALFTERQLKLRWFDLFRVFYPKFLLVYLSDFWRGKVFSGRRRFLSWLYSVKVSQLQLRHPLINEIVKEKSTEDYIWYFFWARTCSDFIAFVEKGAQQVFVRAHGFDIFKERSYGHIPFRRQFLKTVSKLLPVSQAGYKESINDYPEFEHKIQVCRMGVSSQGLATGSTDGIFRLISCSNLIPLKRIDLLLNALFHITDLKIIWEHFGDGPMLDHLKERAKSLPVNIKASFHGFVQAPVLVSKFYVSRPVDLFINVSLTEGVPVSIMEALSAGIPVCATDVGGTKEIADNLTGRILPVTVSAVQLAQNIRDLLCLPEKNKEEMRLKAYSRFLESCSFDSCMSEFMQIISTK